MAGLGFEVSPLRLQRQLMDDLHDDSLELDLPPRPEGLTLEDTFVSGLSLQTSTSRMSDTSVRGPTPPFAVPPSSATARHPSPTVVAEAPTPRARPTHKAVSNGDAELSSSSLGLPVQSSTTSSDGLASGRSSTTSNGSPGQGRAAVREAHYQATLASVLARNASVSSTETIGTNEQQQNEYDVPGATSTSLLQLSDTSFDVSTQTKSKTPATSTPQARKTATPRSFYEGTTSASSTHTAVRPGTARINARRPSADIASNARTPTGEQAYHSADDFGQSSSQRVNWSRSRESARPSLYDLSISTIASESEDRYQGSEDGSVKLPTPSSNRATYTPSFNAPHEPSDVHIEASEKSVGLTSDGATRSRASVGNGTARSNSRTSSSSASDIKAGGTPQLLNEESQSSLVADKPNGVDKSSDLHPDSSPHVQQEALGSLTNHGNMPNVTVDDTDQSGSRSRDKKDLRTYVLDSIKRHESLQSGQRRRIVSGESPRAANRLMTPSRVSKENEPPTSSSGTSSLFAGPRMDRVGKANTFKAGRTPIPRRVSPLVAEVTPSRDALSDAVSETSSNDLMRPVHGGLHANASFPGLGAGEDAPPSGARVDDKALMEYLHKINSQLDAENQEVRAEKDLLHKQLSKALRELEASKIERQDENAEGGQVSQIVALQDKVSQLQGFVSDQQEELMAQEEERTRLIKELEVAQSRLREVEQAYISTSAESTLQQLQREHDEMRIQLDSVKGDKEALAKELEDEQRLHEETVDKLKRRAIEEVGALERDKERSVSLENVTSENERLRAQLDECEADLAACEDKLDVRQSMLTEAEKTLNAHVEVIEELELKVEELTHEVQRVNEELRQVEDELQHANDELRGDDEEFKTLDAKMEALEAENAELRQRVEQVAEGDSSLKREDNARRNHSAVQPCAHNHELSLVKVENSALRERVHELQERNKGLRSYHAVAETSAAILNVAGMSKSYISHKSPRSAPKTPNGLSSMTQLNESSIGGETIMRQLAAIQEELDAKNASVDAKMDRLEELRSALLSTQEQLLVAQHNNSELVRQSDALWSANGPIEKARRSLKQVKCPDCFKSFDVAAKMEHVQCPTESRSALANSSANQSISHAYDSVDARLRELESEWATERKKWISENEALTREIETLQNGAHGLRHDGLMEDLDEARRATQELNEDMKQERRRISGLAQLSQESSRDRAGIEIKLSQTERELSAVRGELAIKAADVERLQAELQGEQRRSGSTPRVERLTRDAELAQDHMRKLEHERRLICQDRDTLFAEYQVYEDRCRNLSAQLQASEEALKAHQAEIDEQTERIDSMMSKLIEKDQQIQSLAGDRDRLKEIRAGVLASIASLDEDLQKAKEQSVQYGEELAKLKAQREGERKIQEGEKRWLESIRTDAELALQRKVRELATMESKLASLEEEMTEHKCPSIVGLEDLHSKHSREAKGLMVQIRYLKTKFMRESDLRADMIHQKAYLTKLVGGLERNEAATLKFISDIGISRNIPPAAKYGASRFRQVALAVRAVSRMKLMSQRWQQTLRVRDAVREAHAAARNLK